MVPRSPFLSPFTPLCPSLSNSLEAKLDNKSVSEQKEPLAVKTAAKPSWGPWYLFVSKVVFFFKVYNRSLIFLSTVFLVVFFFIAKKLLRMLTLPRKNKKYETFWHHGIMLSWCIYIFAWFACVAKIEFKEKGRKQKSKIIEQNNKKRWFHRCVIVQRSIFYCIFYFTCLLF